MIDFKVATVLPSTMMLATTILITNIIVIGCVHANYNANTPNESLIKTPVIGYRVDTFKWSIPGNTVVNKNSELTWQNKIFEYGVQIETAPTANNFSYSGMIKYGNILGQSKVQDSDWDKIGEFSRTSSKTKGSTNCVVFLASSVSDISKLGTDNAEELIPITPEWVCAKEIAAGAIPLNPNCVGLEDILKKAANLHLNLL